MTTDPDPTPLVTPAPTPLDVRCREQAHKHVRDILGSQPVPCIDWSAEPWYADQVTALAASFFSFAMGSGEPRAVSPVEIDPDLETD